MCFSRNWRKSYHKNLRRYADHRIPKNTEVFLITKLPWLLVTQCLAIAFGIRSAYEIPWWILCIVSVFLTASLIVVYFRERDNDLVGFFRYNSVFYALLAVSIMEASATLSLAHAVPHALIFHFLAALITTAVFSLYLRKRIENNTFLNNKKESKGAYGLAGAIGYASYFAFKRILSDQAFTSVSVTLYGILAAGMILLSVAYWLKAIGTERDPGQ